MMFPGNTAGAPAVGTGTGVVVKLPVGVAVVDGTVAGGGVVDSVELVNSEVLLGVDVAVEDVEDVDDEDDVDDVDDAVEVVEDSDELVVTGSALVVGAGGAPVINVGGAPVLVTTLSPPPPLLAGMGAVPLQYVIH